MAAQAAWEWCWLDPRCLAFPVAWLAGLIAIARRVDAIMVRKRGGRGCLDVCASCFAGATLTGCVSFGLMLGGGSLWPKSLGLVFMGVLLSAVAVDWSAESASGFMRGLLLTTLEAYLTKLGYKLQRTEPDQSRPRLPDEPGPLSRKP